MGRQHHHALFHMMYYFFWRLQCEAVRALIDAFWFALQSMFGQHYVVTFALCGPGDVASTSWSWWTTWRLSSNVKGVCFTRFALTLSDRLSLVVCASRRALTWRAYTLEKSDTVHWWSASEVPYRTFVDWHTIGSKFIAIACGGSIYSLVLIAGLGLRVSIAYLVGTMHLHLADMLRSPPEGELYFRYRFIKWLLIYDAL